MQSIGRAGQETSRDAVIPGQELLDYTAQRKTKRRSTFFIERQIQTKTKNFEQMHTYTLSIRLFDGLFFHFA